MKQEKKPVTKLVQPFRI